MPVSPIITKKDAAKMLYEINSYTSRSLAESFVWDSDIPNPIYDENTLKCEWLEFLHFMELSYPIEFNKLVNGAYVATTVPTLGYDTSVFAYFDALDGKAHWAPAGKTPREDLPRLPHTERDQYEIISAYFSKYPALASELVIFYNEMNDKDMKDYTKTIQTAFDTFWSQPVTFDASQPGCSLC